MLHIIDHRIAVNVGRAFKMQVQASEIQINGSHHSLFVVADKYLGTTAAEGAVLLKNDGMLPLAGGTQLSLFGRVQRDWFYTGYGLSLIHI